MFDSHWVLTARTITTAVWTRLKTHILLPNKKIRFSVASILQNHLHLQLLTAYSALLFFTCGTFFTGRSSGASLPLWRKRPLRTRCLTIAHSWCIPRFRPRDCLPHVGKGPRWRSFWGNNSNCHAKNRRKNIKLFKNLRTKQEISYKFIQFIVRFVNYLEIQFLTWSRSYTG